MGVLTQVQSWVQRYLIAIDNSGIPNEYVGTVRPRGGVLGAIEYLQSLTQEGITRGFIGTGSSAVPNAPQDADMIAAGYPKLSAATLMTIATTLQELSTSLVASRPAGKKGAATPLTTLQILYLARK